MPIQPNPENSKSDGAKFQGFALPTSNTTYTPNQFFDVCLPHCSRGCLRLVALLIRQTLGWCDEHGNPQGVRHLLSWDDFQRAGISREMIRAALAEAIQGHFIQCVRQPRQQKSGQPAISGLYELKWDSRPGYFKDPAEFRGFFAGEGNRTYIPNQFFDHLVPHEPLAVVKVVGSVIRFSIGFQNKWGHRRTRISLSYQHIQNYSLIRDRKTLSGAIRHALASNYIERVEEGYFDADAGKLSKAAVYAVKWLSTNANPLNGQKTPPGIDKLETRSENPTGNGQKTPPAERSENPTDIEIKQTNKTLKQNGLSPEAAASFEKLKEAGFDHRAARAIAAGHSFVCIDRQIGWIDRRGVRRNRLGMLRRAIEEDWPRPESVTSARTELGQPNRPATGVTIEETIRNIERRFSDLPPTS
jgi:hypothetical protein